jgi:ELWxxDGT repeat protein
MKSSSLHRWSNLLRGFKRSGRGSHARRRRQYPAFEALEDRTALSLVPQMVLDINANAPSSSPSGTVAIGSTAYFAAHDGVHGIELWKSNGTASGTALVKDINTGYASSYPGNLTNVNGTLFFTVYDGTYSCELWKSDGTADGTVLVKEIPPQILGWAPHDLTNVNGTLFFADDDTHGFELWKSDGTAAGTTLVADIFPGEYLAWSGGVYGGGGYFPNSSNPQQLTNVNGTLFFTADDGTGGRELWKSDSTGTFRVKDIYPGGASSSPGNLTNVNGTLFFSANDGTHGVELWKSDGTEAGTVLVNPGGASSYTGNMANVNGTLFFSAADSTNGCELWKSDGTAAGTILVKDIFPGGASSSPSNLTNVNGTLFFTADDGMHGCELWKSDGAPAGTVLVKDIYAGSAGASPANLTVVNGLLLFTAVDGAGVSKLWQSDGTPAGTVRVSNLAASSLTNVNGTLLFSADDGIHGEELWKLVDGPTQAANLNVSGFPTNVTAGVAGSFTVTAKNADGSTNTSYHGTVHFTSGDPQAVLPGIYTFTSADGGVHTFTATLKTAGSRSITVTDPVFPTDPGTQAGITVNPAAASSFTVAGFPSPVTAGAAGIFTVTARDAYGNRATSYSGTVRFTSSDAKAVLPGNYTFTTADAGVHSFTAVLKTAGSQYVTATDTDNAAIVGTQSVTVNPAAASRFVLSAPTSVKAGAKFNLTVTVVDAFGNVATGYRGTISFRSSDSTSTLPKSYAFTAADLGVHTFTGLILRKKGTQTITVTDTLDSSVTASVSIDVV